MYIFYNKTDIELTIILSKYLFVKFELIIYSVIYNFPDIK